MPSDDIIVCGDGHFHLYPSYDPARALSELIRNLDALVEVGHGNIKVTAERDALALPNGFRSSKVGQRPPAVPSELTDISGTDQEREIFRIAFLTEGAKCDYFSQMAGKQFGEFQIIGGLEANCLNIVKGGEKQLVLVAGRQIATAERLEILGLGMEEKISDGLPAEEIIDKIIAAGGLPVLPFSPGKWLFRRVGIVRHLAEKYGRKLIVGDSALRPIGWGAPEIMRRARESNRALLAGSDPLPLAGEEKYAGRYGFVYQGPFDSAKPLTAIREIIAHKPEAIVTAGRRRSMANVMISLYRLQRKNKTSSASSASLR